MTVADTLVGGPPEDLSSILGRIDELATRASLDARELRALRDAIVRGQAGRSPAHAEPLGLAVVVDAAADEEHRSLALHRLRLQPESVITTFAVLAEPAAMRTLVGQLRARSASVHDAVLDGVGLVLARDLDDIAAIGAPVGSRVAFAPSHPAVEAPSAWAAARLGLRFARPSPRDRGPYSLSDAVLVDASQLGAWALLAHALTEEQLDGNPEVRRLNRLVSDHGEDMLVSLEAVAATNSLRKAAALLHLHHNSVAYRVERAENYLGYSFTEPYGRNRLFLALVLRRLQETSRLVRRREPDGPRIPPSDR